MRNVISDFTLCLRLQCLRLLMGHSLGCGWAAPKASTTAGAEAARLTAVGRCRLSEGRVGTVGCDEIASGVSQAGACPQIFGVSVFLTRVVRWHRDASPSVVMQTSFHFSAMRVLHGGSRCVFVIRHI